LALEDGVVTPDERADLEAVATPLGLTTGAVESALEGPASSTSGVCELGTFSLALGDTLPDDGIDTDSRGREVV
jgi:hypothetical protein